MKAAKIICACLMLAGFGACMNWPFIDIPNPKGLVGFWVMVAAGLALMLLVAGEVAWKLFGPGGRS